MNNVKAAIGIILKENKVYVSKRKNKENIWEFPGGKVKKDENIVTGLKRELLEEVGIIVLKYSFFQYINYITNKKKIKLYFFLIKKWKGRPYGVEGNSCLWKFLYNLKSCDFLPANHNIITSLKKKYLCSHFL